jgi:hypothetical protein
MILFCAREKAARFKRPGTIIMFTICLFTAEAVNAAVYQFNETEGAIKRERIYLVNESSNGYNMTSYFIHNRDTITTEEFFTTTTYAVLNWKYREPHKNIFISGIRKRNEIILSGIYKGKKVNRTITIDSLPWYQRFPFHLSNYFKTNGFKKVDFWAVGTDGSGALKPAKFAAKPQTEEPINIQGKTYATQHVRIAFFGMLASLWHCDAWFTDTDAEYMVYKGKNGPFSQETMATLVKKEN